MRKTREEGRKSGRKQNTGGGSQQSSSLCQQTDNAGLQTAREGEGQPPPPPLPSPEDSSFFKFCPLFSAGKKKRSVGGSPVF